MAAGGEFADRQAKRQPDQGVAECDLAASRNRPYRLAVIAPHVVQYHAPLYRKLAEHEDLDVFVFYLDRTGVEPTHDATMGVDILWNIPLLEGYPHTFVRNWSPFRQQQNGLRRINPGLVLALLRGEWDAILIQGFVSVSDWIAFLGGKLAGRPILFRGEAILRPHREGLREKAKAMVLRLVFAWSDRVLFSCRGNREYFLHYGCPEEKLSPIPCAVDNDFFRRRRDELVDEIDEIIDELQLPRGQPIILNVSRHEGGKSHTDLLQAVRRLADKGIEASLVLVGSGPESPALEKLTAELRLKDVRFVGFVNQKEIARYYACADLFALTSVYDASPKVLNEAINFELPLVCSNRVGTAGDVVVDGDNGLIYEWGSIEQLSAALEALVVDRETRRRMGRRSLEIADCWSLDADVEAMLRVLGCL